jgi:hypothetical protein
MEFLAIVDIICQLHQLLLKFHPANVVVTVLKMSPYICHILLGHQTVTPWANVSLQGQLMQPGIVVRPEFYQRNGCYNKFF